MASEVDFMGIIKLSVAPNEETPQYVVSYDDIVANVISIITRVINICINIALAIAYYKAQDYNYFIWTILSITIPVIVTTAIQIVM